MALALKSTSRTDKVIQAAGTLFARQGYHATSTREIAHLAGVSENTIFRHFDNKEDLFWSSIRSHSAGLKFRKDLSQGLERCDSLEVVLPKIIELLTETVKYKPELPRLIAVAFLELHWKAEAFCREHLSPTFMAIRQYLAASIQKGEMRDMDPSMATAALASMVMMHFSLSRLVDGEGPVGSDNRKAARAYTRFWLDVLNPRPVALVPHAVQIDEEQSA
jgi:AcrR family transcriptional regulator